MFDYGVCEDKTRCFWIVPEEKKLFIFFDHRGPHAEAQVYEILELEVVDGKGSQDGGEQAGSIFVV